MANEAKDKETYIKELKSSSRPDALVKTISNLLDDIEAIYDEAIKAYTNAKLVSTRKISAAEYNGFTLNLERATARSIDKVSEVSEPLLSSVSDYIQAEATAKRPKTKKVPLPRTTRDNYVREVKKYVNGQSKDLKASAKKTVQDWLATGSDISVLRNRLSNLLENSKGHTGTVIRSEIQNAYVELVKDVSSKLGISKVTRWVASTACELCKALEGDHDANSDEAYEVPHPNCACTFHPQISEANMAKSQQLIDMSDLSHSTVRSLLQSAINAQLKKTNNYIYIRDVFDDYFVFDLEISNGSSYSSKTYQCSYVIDAKRKVTLGEIEEVIPVLTYEPLVSMAHFTLSNLNATFKNGSVIRRGKIFESGDYPDKSFELTNEELQAAVDAFEPVDLDIEHMPTVLDGKLGQLKSVAIASDGKSLLGEVEIPDWLHGAIGDVALKVSTTWDRIEKKLIGLALVLSPRVGDAAIFSAFAGRRHSEADAKDFQSIHDLMVSHGAICSPIELSSNNNEEDYHMANQTRSTTNNATLSAPNAGAPAPINDAPANPGQDELIKRLAALEEQNARLLSEAINAKAASFADSIIRSGQALPVERDAIIDDYVTAAQDDYSSPTKVKFSKAGERVEGTRIEALTVRYAARPKHNLVTEAGDDLQVLADHRDASGDQTQDGTKPKSKLSEERRQALMKKTPLGIAMTTQSRNNGVK